MSSGFSFREQQNYALTAMQKIAARTALSMLEGSGLSLEDAARIALAGRRAVSPVLVRDACDKFLRSRIEGKARPSSVQWYMTRLDLLAGATNGQTLDATTREHLEAIAANEPRGESTRRSYYRAWRALWRWAMKQNPPLCAQDATTGLPVSPTKTDHEIGFLTVPDAAKIMSNCAPKFRPAAALLLFAGVRPQEVWGTGKQPLRWEAIDTEERTIRIPAEQSKTRRARIIEGLPDAVWRFLDVPHQPDQPVCPGQSQWLIRHIQIAGGFRAAPDKHHAATKLLREWTHDVTRHTFASYAVALTNDPGKVSLWLGHQGNPTMLHRHYRGLARKADAERYFAIRPTERR